MPGTVSEVSATLVASTMRRPLPASKTRSCSACDRRANSGRISAAARRAACWPGACAGGRRPRGSRARRAGRRGCRRAPLAPEFVDGVGDGVVQVVARVLSSNGRQRCSTGNSRPETWITGAGPCVDGEVLREAVGVDRRRGDDHLQVGPARQDLPQVAEQEVDVQAALVRLVDDQRVVGAQQRVASASRRAGCRRSSA